MKLTDVTRVHLGHFTAPASSRRAGQKVVVDAFLIRHPNGPILLDTGIGEGEPEAEELYHPVRRPLRDALAAAGTEVGDVGLVVNCHLHFDHAGGNYLFPRVPIVAQATEYAAVHDPDYTLPGPVADFDGARFETVDGDAAIATDVYVVATPGHTPGHQSLVVRTDGGTIVLAGQAYDGATDYAAARYALRAECNPSEPPPEIPEWVERFDAYDPVRVMFAHDPAVWDREHSVG